jgi:hypothetical protein
LHEGALRLQVGAQGVGDVDVEALDLAVRPDLGERRIGALDGDADLLPAGRLRESGSRGGGDEQDKRGEMASLHGGGSRIR